MRSPPPLLADRQLLILFAATSIGVQGISSVAPALPAISAGLSISAGQAGWLIAVFALPGIFLSPLLGVLADRFGRKAVLVPSLLLYGTAGTACVLAPSFEWLVALRLFQGVGAAVINTLVFTIIGDLYEGQRRATATGYNSGALSIAAALYPVIGGVLAEFSWQLPFLLPLLAFPVAALAWWGIALPRIGRSASLAGHLKAMMKVIANGQVLSLFYISLVVFVAIFGAFLTYAPFLLSIRFAASEMVIGLVFALNAGASAIMSFSLGAITRHVSHRTLILSAMTLLGLVLAAFPYLPTAWTVAAASVPVGIVMGAVPALVLVRLLEVEPAQRGSLIALNGAMFRAGQTVGPLIAAGAYAIAGFEGLYVAIAFLVLTSAFAALRWIGAAQKSDADAD